MVLEHEIPEGSKVYFGEIAKRKRKIESIASELFYQHNFEEMVTPIFSYHQIDSIPHEKLIHLTDKDNYPMNLRADSTVDVSKLMLKRVGRTNDNSRWFYIQPVYRYPSIEQYQIGAESIGGGELKEMLQLNIEIFEAMEFQPILQISNVAIPRKIAEELNLSIDIFKNIEIKKILALQIDWLQELLYLEDVKDIDRVFDMSPQFIRDELEKIKELVESLNYKEVKIAPLYYTKMDYYNNLIFKFLRNNRVFARGGNYSVDGNSSVGFSIYTDEILNQES